MNLQAKGLGTVYSSPAIKPVFNSQRKAHRFVKNRKESKRLSIPAGQALPVSLQPGEQRRGNAREDSNYDAGCKREHEVSMLKPEVVARMEDIDLKRKGRWCKDFPVEESEQVFSKPFPQPKQELPEDIHSLQKNPWADR
ncbi:hypothetical protein CB1_000692006 [Camelus ferus]|nr:hypothetical protein CB1_000692006 [Camelus ferus]